MTGAQGQTWLGDPSRFSAVIKTLSRGAAPTLEQQLAADWVGSCYGPSNLIAAAELVLRCTDCRGRPILAVTHIDDQPLMTSAERGDRLDPKKPGKRSWQFGWLNYGSVAHARCDDRYLFDLSAIRKIVPPAGTPRHTVAVGHSDKGGLIR